MRAQKRVQPAEDRALKSASLPSKVDIPSPISLVGKMRLREFRLPDQSHTSVEPKVTRSSVLSLLPAAALAFEIPASRPLMLSQGSEGRGMEALQRPSEF